MLDWVEGIEVNADRPPIDNLHGIIYLRTGLRFLADNIRREEIAKAEKFGSDLFSEWTGEVSNTNVAMIASAFCWFAVSLVSYLSTVGLIQLMQRENWRTEDLLGSNSDRVKSHCKAYVKRVAAPVLHWRSKIGAHFAITDPYRTDNVGMLEASLLQPVWYRRPHYVAGIYWKGTTKEEWVEDQPWALTRVFEEMAPRLWPDAQLKPLDGSEGAENRP
jgi:hypothetical protein